MDLEVLWQRVGGVYSLKGVEVNSDCLLYKGKREKGTIEIIKEECCKECVCWYFGWKSD